MKDVKVSNWGEYKLFSLVNNKGTQIDISDLGGLIVNFYTNDISGNRKNIVLGYDTPEQYLNGKCYLGCLVGPWANRIANGHFSIGEDDYQLECNEGTNHLHGASASLGAKRWNVEIVNSASLRLSTMVESGDAGYPCDIEFKVEYHLSEDNALSINYQAFPRALTPINMTQHTYFNLGSSADVLDHFIQIEANDYLHVDALAIPLFKASVEDTPFDLRTGMAIREGLSQSNEQLENAGGYDHCWCFDSTEIKPVARVFENNSGIELQVATDQIGMQFYSGNFLNNEIGRDSNIYNKHAGLCLETQCYPNQINMDNKQECIYGPDRHYQHNVIYKVFTTKN
ncbi:galactose mutarotase [Vibrio breoganii]|uniref:Aldose 1-epimerase n=1 Tax=Vibrio breoganii TaxID=553239 RepID=A0AAN1CTV1_9VIBR|nr:aldose epimerase family protein [Vibrio breoganii]ANO35043.1 galactose mutarotase [Vibrio breoganii]OED86188.1 galactose mutarotase [Vibrio breoganii ZF-55]PMG78854.1 galactose mutarotase [Vibrio breoganii]PML07850.1 galactose mutarotase [Vibrio breoganii]PMO59622.1 galactose mutarotase [Vibrio breoganii]